MEVDSSSSTSSSVHASATQWQLSFQLTGHTHTVRDIAVSSSTLLATCEERGVVHIWERTEPHERTWTKRTFEDNQIHQSLTFVIEAIADAQLSHTSTYPAHTFCTGGGDKVARPFTSNGTKFTPLQGHTNSVSSITRNIHNQLITGSWDGTAKVWIGEQCIATYTGHEHAVEVLGLANGRIITGSANKSIHIIENDQIIRKITNAHGHAIRKLASHPFGFASVGNDGLLKVWDSDGNELVSIVAHTEESKFIYGLAVLSTGELVTCGEDGNVKIWNTTGTLIQSIPHPGPVRCVKILPGDDIITGCADRVARVFTQSEQRRASAAELSEYDELIGMVVASGMRALDTSTLPTDEALSKPGQKDGQVIVVNIRGRGPIAYQWSQEAMTWIEIGEALGSSSSNKSTLEGKEYDHVTEVYLTETDKVKLGFNKEDDPNEVVDNFMALYAIPADMRSQIYNHVAPLTDPHLVAAKKEREAKKAAELHLLQVPAWSAGSSEIYGTGNLKAMKERILKTNAEYTESNSPFAITDTGSIERLFTNLNNIVMYHASPFTSGEIGVVKQLLQWPDKEALAPMDMVRILMVHAEANKALGENSEVQQALFTHAKRGGDTHKILLLKVLSNWIAKRARPSSEREPNPTISSSVLEYLSNAMDVVADCVRTSNDKLAEAYIMFLYNFICWYGRFRIPESDFYLVLASGVIELLCGSAAPPRSDKVVYYGLLVLGTIVYISKDAATIVQASFGEQLAALVASATASANAAVREVGQDCAKLFQTRNSTTGRGR